MSDDVVNYLAAAIVVAIKISKNKSKAPDSDTELLELFKDSYERKLTQKQLDLGTRRLTNLGIIKAFDDPYTGKFYRIPIGISLGTQIGMMPDRDDLATFKKATAGGRDFLERVFRAQRFWEDLDLAAAKDEMDSEADESAYAPASDRTVRLNHNSEPVIEILAETRSLAKQLETGNDLGELSPDEADAALAEVKQIVSAFEGDSVRVDETFARVKSTLTWIGNKAAEAVVGSMALSLLLMIANFLGIAI